MKLSSRFAFDITIDVLASERPVEAEKVGTKLGGLSGTRVVFGDGKRLMVRGGFATCTQQLQVRVFRFLQFASSSKVRIPLRTFI